MQRRQTEPANAYYKNSLQSNSGKKKISVSMCMHKHVQYEYICILPAGSCYVCLSSPRGQSVGSLVPLTYYLSWLSILHLLSQFYSQIPSLCKQTEGQAMMKSNFYFLITSSCFLMKCDIITAVLNLTMFLLVLDPPCTLTTTRCIVM